MPVQGSWVEHWLERYCAPGHHQLAPWRPGMVKCNFCHKEEFVNGRTCLVCGIPGERAYVLADLESPGRWYKGKLCGPCEDEFRDRIEIRGWRIVAAG